ncbi:hypothetical protein GCM10010166_43980 [Couchioplanes caeruleus subsp. azureus]|nr:hypothetical protein GCM10010166_43980 [Couchioplanes caeruleus subsp. azureus]
MLAVLVATSGLALAAPTTAGAAPRPPAAPGDSGDDGEGGSKSLVEQLEAASKGFVEAREALARSKKRQQEVAAKLEAIDAELGPRQGALDDIARQSYRTGRLGPMTALLTADSSQGLLDRATTLESVAVKQEHALRQLQETRAKQAKAKLVIDAEVRDQQRQLDIMTKRKAQADKALKAANAAAGGPGGSAPGGNSAQAGAAPRNPNGELPDESCSLDDPTTSGCITPRTLHAMKEAQADGFDHFVSCFRPQGSGEHPLGRACDFAADKDGFGGVATGANRTYGDRLADYFVDNEGRLGVLYVIWFKRIWLPSSGWQPYLRGTGEPNSDHTNHVHLSMR